MKVALPLAAVLGCACATGSSDTRIDARFQQAPQPMLHKKPLRREATSSWQGIQQTTLRPLSESLNPGYWILQAIGGRQALDINGFGEVIDSPWYQNRLTRADLRPQDFAVGHNARGPAPGPFKVLGGKTEGATPGLLIEDTLGQRFLVKFDPPAYPELASAAEMITSRILWAAGYNVPESYLTTFSLDRLELTAEATTGGKHGSTVPLTQDRLRNLIALVNPFPDGRVRALFSKLISGKGVGPFDYRGTRYDDPNDIIPHEQRRSLRGLGSIAAWVNNVDTLEANTYDAFVASRSDPSQGYLKHYLLDFGDALGSAGTKPKYLGLGYEGLIDWPIIARSLFSAGIWYRRWLPVQRSPFRSVGVFEAQVYDPRAWRPKVPNPAFDSVLALDRYWAASIIARFDVDDLVAIVEEAKYSDPKAAAWVLRVLLERQYRTVDWAFSEVLPLDRLHSRDFVLVMEDLAIRAGLYASDEAGYQYRVFSGEQLLAEGENYVPEVDLESIAASLAPDEVVEVTVQWKRVFPTVHPAKLRVTVELTQDGLRPIGLEREVE